MNTTNRLDIEALGLTVTRYTAHEAYCVCPFHADHTPSASISLKTGLFHCFACGHSANAVQVARELGGHVIWTSAPLDARLMRVQNADLEWVSHTRSAVDNEYLEGREVRRDQIVKYELKENSSGVIIPLKDHLAKLVGVQLRRYDGMPRYLTYGEKPPLWPMSRMYELRAKETLYVVEGVFGVLRAEQAGLKAVALMGAGAIEKAVPWLSGWPHKVFVFDNDDAGYMGMAKLVARTGGRAVTEGVEADELTVEQWRTLLEWNPLTRNAFTLLKKTHDPTRALQTFHNFMKKRKA